MRTLIEGESIADQVATAAYRLANDWNSRNRSVLELHVVIGQDHRLQKLQAQVKDKLLWQNFLDSLEDARSFFDLKSQGALRITNIRSDLFRKSFDIEVIAGRPYGKNIELAISWLLHVYF